jgi:hypothetical protein
MPVAPLVLTKPKLLLGEGQDEVRFFKAFLDHLGITDVQVADYGGKTNFARYLQALAVPAPGYRGLVSLGVTRDADTNPVGAFQSVCAALGGVGLSVPGAHGQLAGGNPQVGVWIMPDGRSPDMLEELCLSSVAGDPSYSCLAVYFTCVFRTANRQPNNWAKAKVHAWLSSQVEPDKRLGEAAESGFWPWINPAFAPIRQFLQSL